MKWLKEIVKDWGGGGEAFRSGYLLSTPASFDQKLRAADKEKDQYPEIDKEHNRVIDRPSGRCLFRRKGIKCETQDKDQACQRQEVRFRDLLHG